MPRQTAQIRNFNQGIISAIDDKDIPIESASDSLNIDGDVAQGILQGIPTDVTFTTNGSATIGNIRLGEFIENDTLYDLIYHDSSANSVRAIVDFHSSKYSRNLITTNVSDNTCLVANNKEVHIGTGYGSANVPKWAGYCEHGQFNAGTSWLVSNTGDSGGEVLITVGGSVDGVADYSATVGGTVKVTTSSAHGLATGERVTISGTTDYNGSFTVTVLSTTEFYITAAYTSSQTGSYIIIHSLKDGNLVKIASVAGTTEANGVWIVKTSTPASGTFILTGSTYANAYTSGGTATQHICVENASVENQAGTSAGQFAITTLTATTGSGGNFLVGQRYYWKFSLVYDGYQESPLDGVNDDDPGVESEYYTMTITADNAGTTPNSFNKRITGINLYRAEGDANNGLPDTLYRFVCFIDINDAGWTISTNDKTITVIDYGIEAKVASGTGKNFGSATYEQNSGISEVVEDSSVNYALACKGEGYMFAGKCYKSDLPDAERYIFRSKELRFDMFDWINDFVILPEPIKAMTYFNGRLFAFSLNNVYRIHPELYIEDVFNGAGCSGQRSVLITEYGMFFANQNGAYYMDNSGSIDVISRPIQRSLSSGKSWRSFLFDTLKDLIVVYSTEKKYVMFINQAANNYLACWAFNILSRRWDYWTFTESYVVGDDSGVFVDKDGEVYLSLSANTYQLMGNTGPTQKQAWEWSSQDMTFGESRQDKQINKIKADVTGTATIVYGVDGVAPATSYTNDAYINSYVKSLKVKLSATSGNNSVDSLEIIYRTLVGKR